MSALKPQLKVWLDLNKPLLDILLDAYCIVDTANRVVDFNTAFTELCGESYRKILKTGDFCTLLKTEFCPDQCPSRQVVATKKPLRVDELKAASRSEANLQLILGAIPLFSPHGEILGSLLTIRNVSAENELQKKYEDRKRESITDGLTRLYNKTFAESALLRQMKISIREHQPFSVVMVDIDYFKKVNDTHGHQCGDYVLTSIAQLLKNEVRETDTVGRYGGEEFIAVLAKATPEGALIFGERFRNRVEKSGLVFNGMLIPVTVSLGTASFHETWTPEIQPEVLVKELVHKADNALYFAKASGRNRVSQWETVPRKVAKAA